MFDYIQRTFFSPLGKESCVYFYILTVLSFAIMLIISIMDLMFVVKHFHKMNTRTLIRSLSMLIQLFLAYFVNRVMYSICVKAL